MYQVQGWSLVLPIATTTTKTYQLINEIKGEKDKEEGEEEEESCNSSPGEAEAEVFEFKASLGYTAIPCLKPKTERKEHMRHFHLVTESVLYLAGILSILATLLFVSVCCQHLLFSLCFSVY